MFYKNDYYVVASANDTIKTFLVFGIALFIFGEIMYEKGKEAGRKETSR